MLALPAYATNDVGVYDYNGNTEHELNEGESSDIYRLMVINSTGISGMEGVVTYDPTVMNITSTENESYMSFGTWYDFSVPGQMRFYAVRTGMGLQDTNRILGITIEALPGTRGRNTTISVQDVIGCNNLGYEQTFVNVDTLLTVRGLWEITDIMTDHAIPNDTDGDPLWGEKATITVIIETQGVNPLWSGNIDLSAIGGTAVTPMTITDVSSVGDDPFIYEASIETSATALTAPGVYELPMTFEIGEGNIDDTSHATITVLCNGDIDGDSDKDILDAYALLYTWFGIGTINSEYSADVSGDGIINICDLVMLVNNDYDPVTYVLR